MPSHPTPERVAVSWLLSALSPFTGVSTTLPELKAWPALSGNVRAFVVVDSVVGGSTRETRMRWPVISVSTWAALLDSDRPQYGAASEVMERIVDKVLDDWTGPVLSWDGYWDASVDTVTLVSPEPRRVPDQDSGRAHYVLDIGMAWTEHRT